MRNDGLGLFEGIPPEFAAVRYHPQAEYDEMILKAVTPLRALSISAPVHDLAYDPVGR